MEFKGTGGVWKRVKLQETEFYTERNEIQYGEDGECVAEFVHDDYDALLISKAPELLDELIWIFENIDFTFEGLDTSISDRQRILKLIRSATEL